MTDPGDSAIGFELEFEPRVPDLPGGQVVVRRDVEDVLTVLAGDLLVHANNCVRAFGDFHMALSGGSTPLPLYARLMTDPLYRSFPWRRTHLWMVDERRVAEDDERSNYGQIMGYLGIEHSDIPEGNLHPMPVLADDAEDRYQRELEQALAWRERGHDRLDFVLLGMGADAHTASLFPYSPALEVGDRLVAVNEGPSVTPPPRLTLTYPMLNAARFVALLVTGAGKRETIARVRSGGDPRELPVLGIEPVQGTLKWFLDHAACPR